MGTPPLPNTPVNININRTESSFLQQALVEFRDHEFFVSRVQKTLIKDILAQLQGAQQSMATSGDLTFVQLAFSQQESEFIQNFLVTWKTHISNPSILELGYVTSITSKLQNTQSQESANFLRSNDLDDIPLPPGFGN